MLETWQEALDYLYRRANWEVASPGPQTSLKLERIRALLEDLGRPHLKWPAVHVAGTNGKGSTCRFLASALQQAGRRVGLYTSPHLHTVRERIQVNGVPISEAAVLAWLRARRPILEAHEGLTTFEALTALAFDYFAAHQVDVAVVEVGLGGRLDTTNVVAPAVSVITPVALDHMAVLGGSLAAIAAEKAGILRPAIPAVSAEQPAEVARVLAEQAAALGVPLTVVGRELVWSAKPVPGRAERVEITALADRDSPYIIELGLLGVHQAANVATAVAALECLRQQGWSLDRQALTAGLAAARWPARYERLGLAPTLIVDAAHNPHGAEALARALTRHDPGRRILILGLSAEKDGAGILAALLPGTAEVLTAQAPHPRAMLAVEVADRVLNQGGSAQAMKSPAAALEQALALAAGGGVVVATGSIFLAAAVRTAWAARGGMPLPPRDPPVFLSRSVA